MNKGFLVPECIDPEWLSKSRNSPLLSRKLGTADQPCPSARGSLGGPLDRKVEEQPHPLKISAHLDISQSPIVSRIGFISLIVPLGEVTICNSQYTLIAPPPVVVAVSE